jgi:hypothetical protein
MTREAKDRCTVGSTFGRRRRMPGRYRLTGAIVAAAIAAVGTGVPTLAGIDHYLLPGIGPAVAAAAVIGGLLAPSLRNARRGRLIAVGLTAGLLVLPLMGFFAALGGATSVPGDQVGSQDLSAVVFRILLNWLFFVLVSAALLIVLVPLGVLWAVLTRRIAQRDAAPSEEVTPAA